MFFATLLEGSLSPLAISHLTNLMDFGASEICVMSSRKNLERLISYERFKICPHYSDQYLSIKTQRNRLQEHSFEINYFDSDFPRINLLKWYLIRDALLEKKHKSIIFSDMDVLWNAKFSKTFLNNFYRLPNTKVLVQKDGSQFCTGIMVWSRTDLLTKFLGELIEFHKESFAIKPYMDQEVFNILSSKEGGISLVKPLPDIEFVIGRNMSKYLMNGSLISTSIAIHANYVVGQSPKHKILSLILAYITNPNIPNLIKTLAVIFWEQKIKLRYHILRNRLK